MQQLYFDEDATCEFFRVLVSHKKASRVFPCMKLILAQGNLKLHAHRQFFHVYSHSDHLQFFGIFNELLIIYKNKNLSRGKEYCQKHTLLVCPWQESNLRPSGPQPDALSTELQGLE